jgi:broad-specificity NMP kinase
MKKLYLIGGTMGIGKTAVCQELKLKLDNSVFLDGDWCWDASPFQVTEETKNMVMENICFLLNQFIHCSAYDNIIFCWVMHEQSIIDMIINNLDKTNCEIKTISLICDEKELRERLSKDIAAGKRKPDVIDRSLARIPLYHQLNTIKINTNGKTVNGIAEELARI